MKKVYSLIANEPLDDFDNFILRALNDAAEHGLKPKSAVMVVLTEDAVYTNYHKAGLQEMMIAKGHIDIDIMSDVTQVNLPFYLEQMEQGDYEEEGAEEL